MVRASAVALFLAVLMLAASSLLWARLGGAGLAMNRAIEPNVVLTEFTGTHAPAQTIELGPRYAGRTELLDPRETLPRWHAHARAQAAAVFAATRQCPPAALSIPVDDPSLAKAYAWHERTCASGLTESAAEHADLDDFVEHPPFMHPSGKSYAALALAASSRSGAPLRGASAARFVTNHARAFHVLELASLDPSALDGEGRSLRAISPWEWTSITRGDPFALSASSLLVVDRDALGVARLRAYERGEWDAASRAAALALVPRNGRAPCALPASSDLCWRSLPPAERHREALLLATTVSAVLVVVAALVLTFAYVRERRRMHADRIHVLRTLTHELRTPAMTLGIDIEHLRTAYDELPAAYQEPLLRVSDGIARLHRVLHRSARYMALFETASGPRDGLLSQRIVPSAKEMIADFSDEWPEGVIVNAETADRALVTDPEWLGVAVRNLVENAFRHGTPPVTVRWKLDDDRLSIRVGDTGSSPSFSLRRATAPYSRDPKSVGLGLGLAIVARVARLLDGKLTHEPSPTTFELSIPVKQAKQDKEPSP